MWRAVHGRGQEWDSKIQRPRLVQREWSTRPGRRQRGQTSRGSLPPSFGGQILSSFFTETRRSEFGTAGDLVGCVGKAEIHTLVVSSYSHETLSLSGHPSSPELTKSSVTGEIHANGLFIALDLRALVLQRVRARCDAMEAESQAGWGVLTGSSRTRHSGAQGGHMDAPGPPPSLRRRSGSFCRLPKLSKRKDETSEVPTIGLSSTEFRTRPA